MYKCLSPVALGISGRQAELLEICLTHRFRGLEIDMVDLVRRAQTSGVEHACRYLASARLTIGGWQLPVRLSGAEADFRADLAGLMLPLEISAALQADRCFVTLEPLSADHPFHENFTLHIDRLRMVAQLLAAHGVQLGIGFLAAASHREGHGYQFVHQAEAAYQLVSALGAENVGLLLDTWNWHVGGGTLDRLREIGGKRIVAVRLGDLPTDADLETIAEDQCMMPGDGGAIDAAAVLALLAEQGYDGPVSIARHPSQANGLTREASVAQASALLDTLWSAAGLSADGKTQPVSA